MFKVWVKKIITLGDSFHLNQTHYKCLSETDYFIYDFICITVSSPFFMIG